MIVDCGKILLKALFAVVLLAMAVGCTKNEVRLTFELPKDVNEPCRILYYASGSNVGMIRETVAQISAGKGETVLPMSYPSVICLFSPSQKFPAALIYASRGESFRITGTDANIARWEISGNKTTEELSAWRLANADLIRTRDHSPEKLNEAVAKFVKANTASPAAAVILYYYFTRGGHEKEFYALQSGLDREVAEDERLMTALSMPDLITFLPDKPWMPERLVLTGDSGYADTVTFDKALLLMFRSNNDSGVSNDSVKALLERVRKSESKAGGKDRRKAVAELYFDIDSFNWRRHMRRDTIKGLTRLWMPLGVADSVAIEMGVRRTPYYIVVTPKGKEAYRGDDWSAASAKFESLK